MNVDLAKRQQVVTGTAASSAQQFAVQCLPLGDDYFALVGSDTHCVLYKANADATFTAVATGNAAGVIPDVVSVVEIGSICNLTDTSCIVHLAGRIPSTGEQYHYVFVVERVGEQVQVGSPHEIWTDPDSTTAAFGTYLTQAVNASEAVAFLGVQTSGGGNTLDLHAIPVTVNGTNITSGDPVVLATGSKSAPNGAATVSSNRVLICAGGLGESDDTKLLLVDCSGEPSIITTVDLGTAYDGEQNKLVALGGDAFGLRLWLNGPVSSGPVIEQIFEYHHVTVTGDTVTFGAAGTMPTGNTFDPAAHDGNGRGESCVLDGGQYARYIGPTRATSDGKLIEYGLSQTTLALEVAAVDVTSDPPAPTTSKIVHAQPGTGYINAVTLNLEVISDRWLFLQWGDGGGGPSSAVYGVLISLALFLATPWQPSGSLKATPQSTRTQYE